MKAKRKLLNDSSGFTLIELILVILVFAIMIVPVYKMLISGAKIQKTSEETYEATLQAQSLLESVRGQIEKDLGYEQKVRRGLKPVATEAKWLTEAPTGSNDKFLLNFLRGADLATSVDSLDTDVKKLRKTFKTDTFLYEVHIWPMENGGVGPIPISMIEYDPAVVPPVPPPDFGVNGEKAKGFTMVEIDGAAADYFEHHGDALLWTKPAALDDLTAVDLDAKLEAETLKGMGVISYNPANVATDGIYMAGSGVKTETPGLSVEDFEGYEGLKKKTKIDYEHHTEGTDTTYEFVISDGSDVESDQLSENDYIYLAVDLATFPYEPEPVPPAVYEKDNDKRILRIENKTRATVVIPMYNEKDLGVKVFPIQHQTKGNIIVEHRDKREPSKNFVIGVVVRDAFNSTFGEPNKVLSKIVDVYSHDYNKQ